MKTCTTYIRFALVNVHHALGAMNLWYAGRHWALDRWENFYRKWKPRNMTRITSITQYLLRRLVASLLLSTERTVVREVDAQLSMRMHKHGKWSHGERVQGNNQSEQTPIRNNPWFDLISTLSARKFAALSRNPFMSWIKDDSILLR